jgi:hypothetical protein
MYGVFVLPSAAVVTIAADRDGVYGTVGAFVLAGFNLAYARWLLRRRRPEKRT